MCSTFARRASFVVAPCFRCYLLHVYPVRSRLKHLHVVQLDLCPVARFSSMSTGLYCGWSFNLCCHSLHPTTLAGNSAGCTELGKQFLDCKRFSADLCPNSEWALLASCFFYSTLAHTFLRMSGGAIPGSKYRSSNLNAFRHSVICLHDLISSGSRRVRVR